MSQLLVPRWRPRTSGQLVVGREQARTCRSAEITALPAQHHLCQWDTGNQGVASALLELAD